MKRLATGLVALALLALFGLGQGLSGEWELEIAFSPTTLVKDIFTSFSLACTSDSWRVSSASDFASWWDTESLATGWVWQEFSMAGAFGPLELEGDLLFGPQVPAFLYSQLILRASLAEAEVGLYSAVLGDAVGGYLYPPGSYGGAAFKVVFPLGTALTLTAVIELGATLPKSGFTIHHISGLTKTYGTSPLPGGRGFTGAELSLTGPFCDGGVKGTLRMEKTGLSYLEFAFWQVSLKPLPIVFGRDADHPSTVKFTLTEKTVTLVPSLVVTPACATVYAGVSRQPIMSLTGIVIYGLGFRCDFNEVEVGGLSAFVTDGIWWAPIEGKPSQYLFEPAPPSWWGNLYAPLFQEGEFEVLWIIVEGSGCCGGSYTAEIDTFFATGRGLFNWSRTLTELSIPLAANFSFQAGFEVSTGGWDGWRLRFTLAF